MVEGAGVGGVSQSFTQLDLLPLSLDACRYCMDMLAVYHVLCCAIDTRPWLCVHYSIYSYH